MVGWDPRLGRLGCRRRSRDSSASSGRASPITSTAGCAWERSASLTGKGGGSPGLKPALDTDSGVILELGRLGSRHVDLPTRWSAGVLVSNRPT